MCHDPAPTLLYTFSLHDALPIYDRDRKDVLLASEPDERCPSVRLYVGGVDHREPPEAEARGGDRVQHLERLRRDRLVRSEEHTSELQSPCNIVCRLLLEKKKQRS